jgi:drug/metabolite transporter (DMT)-like permease
MVRIGGILVFLGLGSLVLPYIGMEIRGQELVEGAQPWLGIVLALIGAGLIAANVLVGRRKAAPAAAPAPQQQPGQPG